MKRQILSAFLAGTLCLSMIPLMSVPSAAVDNPDLTTGTWTVENGVYQAKNDAGGTNFCYYPLGSASSVTVSADISLGEEHGFMFAVTDSNGSGKIDETGDTYYLVDLDTGDHNVVKIERNTGSWQEWAYTTGFTFKAKLTKINLTVSFDEGVFRIYVDGVLIGSWVDSGIYDPPPSATESSPNVLTGVSFGLCSKSATAKFENVTVGDAKTVDAVSEAKNGSTVKLTDDVYCPIVIPESKNITLDLNGHYVFGTLVNRGELILTDSKGSGHIEVRSWDKNRLCAIDNYGTLTLDGATARSYGTGGSTQAVALLNRSGATLTVKSGLLEGITERDCYSFGIQNFGTIKEISGGRIVSDMIYRVNGVNNAAITNDNGGRIEKITGGEIYARTNGQGNENYAAGIRNCDGSSIGEISGGYIYAEAFGNGDVVAFGIFNRDDSTIEKISGGVIEGYITAKKWAFCIRNEAHIGEISGGLFHTYNDHTNGNNCVGVANFGSATIDSISGGVFYVDAVSSGKITLRCNDTSSVKAITGGAFYVGSGSQYILDNGGKNNYAPGYSLQAGGENGYRFVAKDGATITETATADGIIANVDGKTYELYADSDKASVGGKVYGSAADAMNAARDGETVKLLGNSKTSITVPEGKNITLDLNGTTLRASLINNGTLTLTDSKKTGRILLKTDEAGEQSAVRNYKSLTLDGASVRVVGTGTATEAVGIKNEKGASLTVRSGRVLSTTQSRKFGFAIRNYGTIEEIAGGELAAEITHPLNDNAAANSNVVAVTQTDGAVLKLVSGGIIWARSNNISGDTFYSSAIRNQGGSTVEKITGGSMRAYALKRSDDMRVSFGIYNENGRIGEISGGYIAGYTSAENFTFGIKNDVNGTIGTISGGYIYAEMDNTRFGPNAIALANWGNVGEISGGTFFAKSYNMNGSTYAVRTNDAGHKATITGGTFFTNKNYAQTIYQVSGGVNEIGEGLYLGRWDEYGRRSITQQEKDTKVVYFLGSSVTYGSATGGRSFAEVLDQTDNSITTVKSAISGTTLVRVDGNSYVSRLTTDFVGAPKPDVLVVQLSTNDASQNKPLGTLSEADGSDLTAFDQTTIIGAIEYIIAYAKQTWDCDVIFYTNPKYSSEPYAKMVEAMPSIQEKWNIGVIDFYNYGCMDAVDNLNSMMSDDIHPNAIGYQWMSEIITDYLLHTSVEDEHHTFEAGFTDDRGRCTECGAYAADYLACFAQIRKNSGGTKDVRVLMEANEYFLKPYTKAELALTFKMSDGSTRDVKIDSEYLVAYTSVKALGDTVNAQNHSGFFGAVVTDVPDSDELRAVSVEASVTFYIGSQSETIKMGAADIK